MLKRRAILLLLIIALATIFSSCVKDVGFSQAENLVLTPVITSSIVFTETEASNFSESGIEIEIVSDSISNVEIFEEQFVKDNLVKAELIFQTINSINRTFNLRVDFLNASDELQHTLTFDVSESSTGNDIITDHIEVFEDDSLDALKLMTQIALTLTLYPSTDGSMLNENSTGKVSLKSKGLFYFNISL